MTIDAQSAQSINNIGPTVCDDSAGALTSVDYRMLGACYQLAFGSRFSLRVCDEGTDASICPDIRTGQPD
jgi:hypothetical protein